MLDAAGILERAVGSKRMNDKKKKVPAQMLRSDLEDLFERLDTDNSKTLTLKEFREIVKKLKLNQYNSGVESFIDEIFYENAEGTTEKTIDKSEFESAYNMLYYKLSQRNSDELEKAGDNFVKATRYGLHQ